MVLLIEEAHPRWNRWHSLRSNLYSSESSPARSLRRVEHAHDFGARRPVQVDDKRDGVDGVSCIGDVLANKPG